MAMFVGIMIIIVIVSGSGDCADAVDQQYYWYQKWHTQDIYENGIL